MLVEERDEVQNDAELAFVVGRLGGRRVRAATAAFLTPADEYRDGELVGAVRQFAELPVRPLL
ncbi:hypothetical protein [Leifsonia xyli]|uniref:hypothetical protein n=1 Tax=Leifsonia xyli TaxID=1575 RepID=UPI0012DDA330|nr:hypothetical protein [Leifsonia xyli]